MTQVVSSGVRIEAGSHGDSDAPALVLIRGLGTQLVQWPASLLQGLVAAGLRVVVFDNRDVGLSQKFEDAGVPDLAALRASAMAGEPPDVPYLLTDMAADTVGVLDHFAIDRAHVLGISMGGMIAQLVAALYPQRTRSLISVMSSSGAPGLPPATPEAMGALMSQPDDPASRASVVEHGLRTRRVLGRPGFPDDDATVRDELGRAYDRCHDPAGVGRQMAAVVAGGSRVDRLREIGVPTLVIHGADDPLIPIEGGRDTARHVPGAALEVIEGMGHDVPHALVPRMVALVAAHCRKADTG